MSADVSAASLPQWCDISQPVDQLCNTATLRVIYRENLTILTRRDIIFVWTPVFSTICLSNEYLCLSLKLKVVASSHHYWILIVMCAASTMGAHVCMGCLSNCTYHLSWYIQGVPPKNSRSCKNAHNRPWKGSKDKIGWVVKTSGNFQSNEHRLITYAFSHSAKKAKVAEN